MVAMLGVLILGVLPGVGTAVGLSLVWLLYVESVPLDAVLGRVPGLRGVVVDPAGKPTKRLEVVKAGKVARLSKEEFEAEHLVVEGEGCIEVLYRHAEMIQPRAQGPDLRRE